MAIRFSCEQCAHSIELGGQFAGRTGHCTHFGHMMTVPAHARTRPRRLDDRNTRGDLKP
jgi:hypothetical protein